MSLCGHNLIETAEGRAGRTHEEPKGRVAAIERIENFITDTLYFIAEDSGW